MAGRLFGGGEMKPPPAAPPTARERTDSPSALDDQCCGATGHTLVDHGLSAVSGSLAAVRRAGVALHRAGKGS